MVLFILNVIYHMCKLLQVSEMMKIQEIAYAASTEDLNMKNKLALEKIKALVDRSNDI